MPRVSRGKANLNKSRKFPEEWGTILKPRKNGVTGVFNKFLIPVSWKEGITSKVKQRGLRQTQYL